MTAGGFTFPHLSGYFEPLLGFRTPATDMGQSLFSQQGTACEQFEMNFYRCVEAFGMEASKRKCDLEYRDLLECIYQRKQMLRFYTMQKERVTQFMDGKLDRPWTKNPPKQFEASPDFYSHNPIAPGRTYN